MVIQNIYNTNETVGVTQTLVGGPNDAAIQAVQEMEETLKVLQACCSQTPVDAFGAVEAYNKLSAQVDAFNKMPMSDPSGFVRSDMDSIVSSIRDAILSKNPANVVSMAAKAIDLCNSSIELLTAENH